MHDIATIYKKVKKIVKTYCSNIFNDECNTRFYPNKPSMNDLEIICLALAGECVNIESECLLWSKIKTDYSKVFKNLPHRTSFNRRRKNLREAICLITRQISTLLIDNVVESETLIIDSIPIDICKLPREWNSNQHRRETDEVKAAKGYNSTLKTYYIGYKLHYITNQHGIFRDLMITAANVHDIEYLKLLSYEDIHLANKTLLGDRAYLSNTIQLKLFEELNLDVSIPYRRNQKDFKKYSYENKIVRKRVETVFAQYVDEFDIKFTYSKSFNGFDIRINTKVCAKTIKQLYNFINEKPINHTKHAFAA